MYLQFIFSIIRNLDRDIENNQKRWRKFVEAEAPEKEKFPQEWKKKDALQRLCMMRALRPDRMTYAVISFVEEKLGPKFVEYMTAWKGFVEGSEGFVDFDSLSAEKISWPGKSANN